MTCSASTWPPLVNTARAFELHAAAIAHAGGTTELRDAGLLESAVSGALTASLYRTGADSPEPLGLAAYLLVYLARNHPFVDGNKRVAWLAMEDQLLIIGLGINTTTDDAERLVLDVVTGKLDADGVIAWLAQRLVARA